MQNNFDLFPRATRSKTGCLTCRRRHKKCDEHKPHCHNCLRNNYVCDGYPESTQWNPTRTPRKRTNRDETPQECLSSPAPGGRKAGEASVENPRSPRRNSDPPSLPFPSLIEGVRTPLERRLFHHFSTVMAQHLVLQTADHANAIAAAVLPLATVDRGLLALVLAVSASHLLKMKRLGGHSRDETDYLDIQRTQWKHLGKGTNFHAQEIGELFVSDCVSSRKYTLALARTMLLCQYNTCEGGADGGWKIHLDAAQGLVSCLKHAQADIDLTTTAVLAEWALYHQFICRVTDQAPSSKLELDLQLSETPTSPAIILIGSRDGLLPIIGRIMELKRNLSEDPSSPQPSFIGLDVGLEISTELEGWSYSYPTRQQRLVGECYRWAAFILLYATVYGSRPCDIQIQMALEGGLTYLDQLCDTDNAQVCALLPMFVFGISAASQRDRDRVRAKLAGYHKWSGLGNIEEAIAFLEMWWEQCDVEAGVSWWQWHSLAAEAGLQPILV